MTYKTAKEVAVKKDFVIISQNSELQYTFKNGNVPVFEDHFFIDTKH